MTNSDAWVLVADSVRARIFSTETPTGPLDEKTVLVHGEGRLQNQALIQDRPGRSFDSQGKGRHDMEVKTDPKRQEQIAFAGEIASHLEKANHKGKFSRLFIVAPPAFMGLLRDKLLSGSKQAIIGQLDKNIARESASSIRGHLPEKLWMMND